MDCRFHGSFHHVRQHLENVHPQVGGAAASSMNIYPFVEIRAFRGYLRTYRHRYRHNDPMVISNEDYLNTITPQLQRIIAINTTGNQAIKIQLSTLSMFERGELGDNELETCTHYINSRLKIVNNLNDFENLISQVLSDLNDIIELFEVYGSGWKLKNILGCDIRISRYNNMRGRCHTKLPQELTRKHAIINVKNVGNDCFMYAFLSVMHYDEIKSNRCRVSIYNRFKKQYNFDCIDFPCKLRDIVNFEKANSMKRFAINVFEMSSLEGKTQDCIKIARLSPFANTKGIKNVNILLYHNHVEGKSHFMGISSLSKLFGKRNHHQKRFCYHCQNFVFENKFDFHYKLCKNFKNQRVTTPVHNGIFPPTIKFREHYKKLPHEYVMYCDFESIMIDPDKSFDSKNITCLKKHKPSGFCLILVSRNEGVVDQVLYRGKDCVQKFFENVQRFSDRVKDIYADFTPMCDLTQEQLDLHNSSTECYLCDGPFTYKNPKIFEHDHTTGEYRGPCCRTCNLEYTLKRRRVPCFFHNFRKYDLHLILGGFKYYKGAIKVIPTNFENYMSIMCDNFVLLDSMMFLNASLDNLVSRLKNSDGEWSQKFKLMQQFFGDEDGQLLSQKGTYCYDYVTSFKQFNEKQLPTKDKFFNVLTEKNITDEEYEYADFVFNRFCDSLGSYHDLYLKVDTILLADVMENFRSIAISNYSLDPAHYITLSGYTWSCALKYTGTILEQLCDVEMYEFFEAGIRGGVSMISTRFATANNKYMNESYDKNKPDSYIIPFDCNNLYGFILKSKLPTGKFKWLDDEKVRNLTVSDIQNWDPNGTKGFVLMVDLEYPASTHIRDNEYPLAPEKIAIDKRQLSNYQHDILEELDIKYNDKVKKLVPHLGDRKDYIVHYKNLQYYLQKGLVLKQVHKVLSFDQSDWLRPYIDFNTIQRQNAKDKFSQDFFKFMINACFGKSMENVRRRKDVIICNDFDEVKKLVNKTNFRRFEIINSEVAIIELEKSVIELDKPIYTGFVTLEQSKDVMYRFHYDVIKNYYKDKAVLLSTDTDSLNYLIFTKDIFSDMSELHEHFDFCEYPKDHFLFSEKNKKVMGKFKDEANSKILHEFVGLAPKMYSFRGEGIWKKAAKGIKKQTVNSSMNHELFKTVLIKRLKKKTDMNLIRSRKHVLHTIKMSKVSLHCFESKRYILDDGIHTLAHNHFLVKYDKK